jgi:hypothetical protein
MLLVLNTPLVGAARQAEPSDASSLSVACFHDDAICVLMCVGVSLTISHFVHRCGGRAVNETEQEGKYDN